MKFKVASKALYSTLAGVSKVINAKNTITILDNFLWKISEGELVITASDTENTLTSAVALKEFEGEEGTVCLNARRIVDIAKELPDVDVEFNINMQNYAVNISFPGGSFDMVGMEGEHYPRTIEEISEMDMWEMICPASQIIAGIEHTLFAVGNNDLQPQLMGILWDITPDAITFVASNSCKLVRYIDRTSAPGITASCIMPVKPAVVLKSLLDKEQTVNVKLSQHSAVFTTDTLTLNCRFIRGTYPAYNRIIRENPFQVTIDRGALMTAVRRVSVCSDPSHGLIKFHFTPTRVEMEADNLNMNTYAHEEVPCDFTGTDLVIGFSGAYMLEILGCLPTENVIIKLADPSRPGLFTPEENEENTDLLMLLMVMRVSD
jgi:DNA polymerase III, beta subunit